MTTVETIRDVTEAAVGLATFASFIIHAFGLDSTPWGRRVLKLSVDVVGAAKVRAGDIPSIPEKAAKQMMGVDP